MNTNAEVTLGEQPLTIRACLSVKFINGRNGLFPTAKLTTDIGTFLCRDVWLETLDEGAYEGEFDIEEISLYSYLTPFAPRELRTTMKVTISSYSLDEFDSADIPELEVDMPGDPLAEEEPEQREKLEVLESATDDDDKINAENCINGILKSAGNDTYWTVGAPLAIPSEVSREQQRLCREILLKFGYKLSVPKDRIWEVK